MYVSTDSYPVIEERALPPVERPWWLQLPWRDPASLPVYSPGAVYVFEFYGCYQDPYSRRVNGHERHVIDATAVSMVQMKDQLITVRRSLPSASVATNLVVSVTFRCLVTDPVSVARGGLCDLDTVLATHVAADRELATLGRNVWPTQAGESVLRIEAQLRAHCTVNPPDVNGVEAIVAAVEVHSEDSAPEQLMTGLAMRDGAPIAADRTTVDADLPQYHLARLNVGDIDLTGPDLADPRPDLAETETDLATLFDREDGWGYGEDGHAQ